jgi:5-methylthioribose kinase
MIDVDANADGPHDGRPALNIEDRSMLEPYLRRHRLIADDEPIEAEVLAGGVSSRVVRVGRRGAVGLVLKQALAKLRVADDWFSDPQRVHREALGLEWLAQIAPGTVTPLVFEDFEHHVIGMEEVPRPHRNWKSVLLSAPPDPGHIGQAAAMLAAIHRGAADRRDDLQPLFADRSMFESLRLEPYYLCAAQRVTEAAPFLTALVDDTRASALTLVHGDYSPKNILIYDRRLFLLDHEVIHWGDPAFDVGFFLAHLLSKAHHCRDNREALLTAAADFVRQYLDGVGEPLVASGLAVRGGRHTLGCLLARVVGRSPLEYLSASERAQQQSIVVSLIGDPPHRVEDVIARIGAALPCP